MSEGTGLVLVGKTRVRKVVAVKKSRVKHSPARYTTLKRTIVPTLYDSTEVSVQKFDGKGFDTSTET